MDHPPLTRRQRQILDFLISYGRDHGIAPTLEEIASNFGVTKITIFGHIHELERKGFIARSAPGISRGIRVLHGSSDPTPGTLAQADSRAGQLNILGTIAAGAPIQAVEEPEVFDLMEMVPSGPDTYVLRVEGESMIEDAICDGDLVLVERREQAHDGETVVAVLPDGDVTLKRFYREKQGFRLQPANSSMTPIFISELEVRGVVIGVIRQLRA